MKHILYIDDNSQACLLLKLFLEKEGYRVFTTRETQTARKVLSKETIDCIITDIGLPDENGIEFYQWVQQQPEYKNLFFLFVSGHAVGFDQVLTEHKDNFITKPIFFPDLIDRLNRELKSN